MGTAIIGPPTAPTTPPTKPNPFRPLEAIELSGLWWLCVSADPERLAYGTFTSQAKAEKYRDTMADGWDALNRGAAVRP